MRNDYLKKETLPQEKFRIISSNFGVTGSLLSIFRDSNFILFIKIELTDKQYLENRALIASGFARKRLIATESIPHIRLFIPNITDLAFSLSNLEGKVTLTGPIHKACYYIRPKISTEFYTSHYFINSPNNFPFPRSTSYEEEIKETSTIENFSNDTITPMPRRGSAQNALVLDYNSKKTAVVATKNENNINGLYIRSQFNESINAEEVEDICSVVSFLTSTKLVYIGSSEIHSDFSKHKNIHISSHDTGIDRYFNYNPYIPFPHTFTAYRDPTFNTEQEFQIFLTNFLSLKHQLNLPSVFTLIQHARFSEFSFQIQPLSAAYDILKTNWFKSEKSSSKGKYLDDTNFSNAIKEVIPIIRKNLNSNQYSDAIIRKIQTANQISFSQKDKVFFDEMGFEYGAIEDFAWRSRNTVVHGSISNDYHHIILMNNAYNTMINRIILHLHGINEYLDYTTNHHTLRRCKDKMLGPSNNGRLPV